LNVVRIEFAAESLPVEVLGCATVRDNALLFLWNRDLVVEALNSVGIDHLLETANSLLRETMESNTPTEWRLRSVS
jgi:hypothetical protein